MINDFIVTHKSEFEKAIEHLKTELAGLRTGRATPALVENLLVEAYGAKMPLNQAASISVPDPKTILVQPWDNALVQEIEKAIASSNLGLGISVKGVFIHLSVPSLTEEKRKNLVKILHEKLELARVSIRGLRDKIREGIIKKEKDKEITEDEKYRHFEELDKTTTEFNNQIKEMGERKEKEIMTV